MCVILCCSTLRGEKTKHWSLTSILPFFLNHCSCHGNSKNKLSQPLQRSAEERHEPCLPPSNIFYPWNICPPWCKLCSEWSQRQHRPWCSTERRSRAQPQVLTASHPSLQPAAALLCRTHITLHSQPAIKYMFSSLHLTGVAFSQWIEGNAVLMTV